MAWGRLDDGLHKSVKWRRATKGARALWTTALSWCMDELNDGHVPRDMLSMLDGTPGDARKLVEAGLWDATKDGYQFHNWHKYQPDAASVKAKADAESMAGALGNHRRWHLKRKVRVPECEYCAGLPEDEQEPPLSESEEADRASGTRSGSRSGTRGGTRIGGESPVPIPIPNPQSPDLGGSPKRRASEHPEQECGRRHDPAVPCGACGAARRRDAANDLEAQRAKSKRERDAHRADRARRHAEAQAAAAEAEDNPEAIEAAKQRARDAVRSARA